MTSASKSIVSIYPIHVAAKSYLCFAGRRFSRARADWSTWKNIRVSSSPGSWGLFCFLKEKVLFHWAPRAAPAATAKKHDENGLGHWYHHQFCGFPLHCVDNHRFSLTHNSNKMVSSDRWREILKTTSLRSAPVICDLTDILFSAMSLDGYWILGWHSHRRDLHYPAIAR